MYPIQNTTHTLFTMEYPLANTYGVRSELFLQSADDYHRQRHRVNKKLTKLRRNLKIVTKDTKTYKEKNKDATICADNYDMEPLFGDVLLYQIERDLLYAQETRLLLDVHTSKSKERFLITKYKKALKHAHQLISTIANEEDQNKVLEILTYTAIIDGSLSISRKKYANALYSFSVARCCLKFLYTYQTLPNIYTKELYYDIIDLVVDPALTVAALQTKTAGISDLTQLSQEQVSVKKNESINVLYLNKAIEIVKKINPSYVTPSNETETEILNEITWGQYNAKISSNDIALAIMKVKNELKNVVDLDASSYDSALIAYQDAVNLHSQEMERNGGNDNDNDDNQEQHIILTYLMYNYLLLRIRRDVTLMKELDNKADLNKNSTRQKLLELWKDCIKVNDSILSSLNEIKELSGIANDDEIMDMLTTFDIYFQIKKQMRLSQAYLISNEYVKSLALISYSDDLIESVKPLTHEDATKGNLPKNEDLTDLNKKIKEEKSKLFILASYFKDNEEINSVGSKYLIDNISKFPEYSTEKILKNVAPLKIDFEPVNVKPVLFDIAYNYIKYDGETTTTKSSSSDTIDEPIRDSSVTEESGDKKKGGFFGLFGR